jgi:hypothetical protein
LTDLFGGERGEDNRIRSLDLHWPDNLGVRFHAAAFTEPTDIELKPLSGRTALTIACVTFG